MAKLLMLGLSASTLVLGLLSFPVHAQKVGNYGGQLADGSPISISVSRSRGQMFVSEFQTQVTKTCKDGLQIDETFFAGGFLGAINQNVGSVSYNSGTTYFGLSLTFDDASRSVSGFALQKYVRLAPGSGKPTTAIVCTVGNQAFAAVLDKQANFNPNLKIVTYPVR